MSLPTFNLPRELRDRIYHYLLEKENFRFTERCLEPDYGTAFQLTYGVDDYDTINTDGKTLPSWLLISKTVLEEGIEQLYRRARCVMYTRCWCTGCPTDRCQYWPTHLLRVNRIQNFDYIVRSVGPSIHTNHMLRESDPQSEIERSKYCIVPVGSENTVQKSLSDKLLDYLISSPNHPVKEIKVALGMPPIPNNLRKTPEQVKNLDFTVDLSYFLRLKTQLDRVIFRLVCPLTGHENETILHHQRLNAIIYPKLQHEAARVGQLLVSKRSEDGSEVCGWTMRDYFEQMRDYNGPIAGAFEWHLEVKTHPSKTTGCIEYEGQRYCRKYHRRHRSLGFDYFEAQDDQDEEKMSWICKETGEIMSLDLPLQQLLT